MAVSKKRDKNVYKAPRNIAKEPSENPKWLLPVMATLLIGGTVWIIVYYVSSALYPLPIGNANLLIGFGMLTSGMILATKWK